MEKQEKPKLMSSEIETNELDFDDVKQQDDGESEIIQTIEKTDYQKVLESVRKDDSLSLVDKINLLEESSFACEEEYKNTEALLNSEKKELSRVSDNLGIKYEASENIGSLAIKLRDLDNVSLALNRTKNELIKKSRDELENSSNSKKDNQEIVESDSEISPESQKEKEINLEEINFKMKNIQTIYSELSMNLNRNKFPRIKSELNLDKSLDLKDNLSELQSQISRIDLPEGQARLLLEAHGFRSVITQIENLRSEVLKLRSELIDTKNSTEGVEKIIKTLENKRVFLLDSLSLLQKYRGK